MRQPPKTRGSTLGKIFASLALTILTIFLVETLLITKPEPTTQGFEARNILTIFTLINLTILLLLIVKPAIIQTLFTLARSSVDLGVDSHAALVVIGVFIGWFLGVNLIAGAAIPLENLETFGEGLSSPATLFTTLAAQTLLYLVLVGYVFSWVRWVNNKQGFTQIMHSLYAHREKLWEKLGLGLALAPLLLLILVVYAKILLELGIKPQPPQIEELFKGFPFLAGVYLSIVAGFAEEVFYRGFLQQRLGLLVATTLFALSHTYYQSAPSLLAVFILGLVIGLAYKYSKSLVTAIALHTGHNIGQFLLLHLHPNLTP
ncbi:MAG: hypothetical protein DRO11_06685 [Methanobacteriota archaeon]|nr:MAG: hypothetical protein DRO11_06685 [Euryarchaeota archaeon]